VGAPLRFLVRQLLREARGSRRRILFFSASLGLGVAAVVATSGFTASVEAGLKAQARPLLGGDVAAESSRPFPPALLEVAAKNAAALAETAELPTVVSAGGSPDAPAASQLVELKAVSESYPLYGAVVLTPARPLAELLAGDRVVVAPEVLTRLSLAVGGTLDVGGHPFVVSGVVTGEPDRLAGPFALGPRIFVSSSGLERSGLVRFGSRVRRKVLLRLPPSAGKDETRRAAEALRRAGGTDGAVAVKTAFDSEPGLREGMKRVDRFLGLVALLSLLVGGVGVALTTRAWIAGRLDALAIMRCLGARPGEVFALYLVQLGLLGLAASAAGTAAGLSVVYLLPRHVEALKFLGGIVVFPWVAALRGLLLGTGVALVFGVPPLSATRRVPPSRVLRRDVDPVPASPWGVALSSLAAVGGTFGAAAIQARSALVGGAFTAGLLVVAGVLALAAWGLTKGVGLLPRRRFPVWTRHGLAAIARPGAATLGSIVAIGLGVLVVVTLALTERQLTRKLRSELPKNAPTAFLLDVQTDQLDGVSRLLAAEGATRIESVPVVMARLAAVNGKRAEELAKEGGREGGRRWALGREQRLTYLEKLPEDNRVTAGALWNAPGISEVSLEEEFARERLGVGLGALLTFDVQGVPIDLKVTSLRKVDWRTFGINFFFVVKPGVLEGAPQFRLMAARLPKEKEGHVQDLLARGYPNVTVIRTREILEKVADVIGRAATAVRALGLFTVAAGILLLAGAVGATAASRGREAALLKTLGTTRAGVAGIFSVEYALTGLVAGGIGTAGAFVLARVFVARALEMAWTPEPGLAAAGIAGSVLVAVVAGLGASARALALRPLETLREE
jgi:putative ABC transport system permease protein